MFERFNEAKSYPLATDFGVQHSDGSVDWKGTQFFAQQALRKALRTDAGAYIVVRPMERHPFKLEEAKSQYESWSWPPKDDSPGS